MKHLDLKVRKNKLSNNRNGRKLVESMNNRCHECVKSKIGPQSIKIELVLLFNKNKYSYAQLFVLKNFKQSYFIVKIIYFSKLMNFYIKLRIFNIQWWKS